MSFFIVVNILMNSEDAAESILSLRCKASSHDKTFDKFQKTAQVSQSTIYRFRTSQ